MHANATNAEGFRTRERIATQCNLRIYRDNNLDDTLPFSAHFDWPLEERLYVAAALQAATFHHGLPLAASASYLSRNKHTINIDDCV